MFRFTTLATFYERLYMYINVYDTLLLEEKEVVRIGYNGFLFPHEYSGEYREATNTNFIIFVFTRYPRYSILETSKLTITPSMRLKLKNCASNYQCIYSVPKIREINLKKVKILYIKNDIPLFFDTFFPHKK